jgi:hypothetical protein
MAGIERLERLEVEILEGEDVVVPWTLREWLLEQLEPIDRAHSICDAFIAVEATHPVALSKLDRAWLVGYLDGLETRGALPAALRPACDGLRRFGTERRSA